MGDTQKSTRLASIRACLGLCTRCPLCEGRTSIVFGSGNPEAKLMLLGEAPGKHEDLRGEPFVGAAGKRLDILLELADLSREDIYITNVLKCRPPRNRNPKVSEIESCAPFLREQIRAISPKVIVTLGNFATQFVLRCDEGITHLRGKFYQTGRFSVYPVYHPAACIYDRSKQPILEQDMKNLGSWLKERKIIERGNYV